MSRIAEAFSNKKAFIPFITAGDPNLDITEKLIIGMADAGADLIEIGIPFSDPVAEGVVIQRADERALKAGTTTDKIFELVGRIRNQISVPLAFMTYINPIFTYGTERFMAACQKYGIDGVIVPDLPYEEKEELLPYTHRFGIDLISLIAPTSHDRIKMIAKEAEGFLYCVSSMGVTGVRSQIKTDLFSMIEAVREVSSIPCAIGFGIATPEQVQEMASLADGAIVGSAIVQLVEQYGTDCVEPVCEYVKQMKEAVKQI